MDGRLGERYPSMMSSRTRLGLSIAVVSLGLWWSTSAGDCCGFVGTTCQSDNGNFRVHISSRSYSSWSDLSLLQGDREVFQIHLATRLPRGCAVSDNGQVVAYVT